MAIVVGSVGLLMVGLGVGGVASPARLLDLVASWQSQLGLYVIAAVRLLAGTAMLLAAGSSRAPLYLQVIGAVAIFSGLVTPFFGTERFAALLGWFRGLPPTVVRVWSLAVVALGASFVWAVLPEAGA